MNLAIAFTLASLLALLAAEYSGRRGGVWLAKPLASTGFVLTAVHAGAFGSPYGVVVLVALLCSWWGDVLLIPKREVYFKLGLGAFLLGHVAFSAAFLMRGVAPLWAFGALLGVVPVGLAVGRWLLPNVPMKLRMPVVAYMAVITIMVTTAAGTYARHGDLRLLLGALMFYLSDLSVARDKFVAPGFNNKLWGLPCYYFAQLLLALTADNAM